jgi:hypothetical protein
MYNTLEFGDLSEQEQDQYSALINKVNGKLLESFARSLVFKSILFVATGGISMVISGPLAIWRAIQNSNAVYNVKSYVNSLKEMHDCEHVNWNTFPSAHLALGGEELTNDTTKVKCPICKHETLQMFSTDYNRDLMSCSNCNKTVIIKYSRINMRQAETLIIPGCYSIPLIDAAGHSLADLDLGNLSSFFEGLVDVFL